MQPWVEKHEQTWIRHSVKGEMHEIQNNASVKTLVLPAGKLVKTVSHQKLCQPLRTMHKMKLVLSPSVNACLLAKLQSTLVWNV